MTLKLGSRGIEVMHLQEKLDIYADGIFGQKTENAVKDYQRRKGLYPDGIVGPKTLASLGITDGNSPTPSTATSTDNICTILQCPLNVHISKLINRDIRYIAIHFTAGSHSEPGKAKSVKNTFEQREASADFAVDDVTIVQLNPDLRNRYCWAVGDHATTSEGGASLAGKAYNRNTVSIEICSSIKPGYPTKYSNHEGWFFTEAVIDRAVELTKMLMKKFNIPLDRVVRHYDITGKLCPGIAGWNDGYIYSKEGKRTGKRNNSSAWIAFKERLK